MPAELTAQQRTKTLMTIKKRMTMMNMKKGEDKGQECDDDNEDVDDEVIGSERKKGERKERTLTINGF